MRYVVRVVVVLIAVVVIFLVPVSTASSSGSSDILWGGLAIDAVAVAALLFSLATWRRRAPRRPA